MLTLSGNAPVPDSAAAKEIITKGKADGSIWRMSDTERDALYHQAYPGPLPPLVGPASPPAAQPVASVPAAPAAPMTPADARAKIDAIMRDPHSDYLNDRLLDQGRKDRAIAEMTQLHRLALGATNTPLLIQDDAGRIRKAPDPTAQAPIPVTEESLPPLTLPPDIPADTPVVRATREMAFFAETPPALLQRAVDAVRLALEREEPSQEELDAEGDRVTAQARAHYGPAFPQWQAALEQGQAIARSDPELRELLEDPRVWNLPAFAEVLVQIGADPRKYYVRRFGTRRVA